MTPRSGRRREARRAGRAPPRGGTGASRSRRPEALRRCRRSARRGSPRAPSPGSTAKPWFWAVTSTRREPVTRTGWFAPRCPNGSLNVRRPSASPTSWWPRQMPKSGVRPSRSRTVCTGPSSWAGSPGPLPTSTADGSSSSTASASHVPGTTTAWTPDSTSLRTIDSLAAEVEQDDPRAGADGVRLGHAGLERGRRRGELRLREHPRPVDVRLRECTGVQLLGCCGTERAAHGAVVAQTPHERSRVDLLERDDAPLCEPGRPGRPRAPHHDALGPHPARLEQPLVDAVVADEGRGEGEHLARVARVGDRLLVARGSGREARLARRHAGGADRAAGEDGAVFEHEVASRFSPLTA